MYAIAREIGMAGRGAGGEKGSAFCFCSSIMDGMGAGRAAIYSFLISLSILTGLASVGVDLHSVVFVFVF